jgi:hypothetical protein
LPAHDERSGLKIGVLTFHRCINYGSYWQARSLVEGLRARGHDAVLLDHDLPEVTRREWRCAFQPLLPTRSPRSDFAAYKAKARKILAAADALPQSQRFHLHRPEELDELDLVLVGSDEVWNMRHPWYGGKAIFYGEGIKAKRLASYAASFGNHDASEGLHEWWADRLRRFDAISVRDDNARAMVRDAIGVEPTLVLDPCLQFPPKVAPAVEPSPYAAVYGHNFPDWYAQAVRAWADRRGIRLISIGYRNDWADEQRIDAGPDDFAALIAGAQAVATNFFHGTVFALLNARPFAAVTSAYRSNKLRDLMSKLGGEAHLVGEQDDAGRFDTLLGTPLDPAIARRIDTLRVQSNAFLDHVTG